MNILGAGRSNFRQGSFANGTATGQYLPKPTANWRPNYQATVDANNGVSQLNDLANSALENRFTYSDDISNAAWTAYRGTKDSSKLYTFTQQYGYITQSFVTVVGQVYEVSATVRVVSGNTALHFASGISTISEVPFTATSTAARYSQTFTSSTTGSGIIGIQDRNAGGFGQIEVTNWQFRLATSSPTYVPTTTTAILSSAFPATQATAAQRPVLSGGDNQANLALQSRKPNTTPWVKLTTTVIENFGTNYDGTATAAEVTATNTAGQRVYIRDNVASACQAGATYILDYRLKYSNHQYLWVGDESDAAWHGCNVDVQAGTIQTTTGLVSSSIAAAGNGFYRVRLTYTRTNAGTFGGCIYHSLTGATTGSAGTMFGATGTEKYLFGSVSLRPTTAEDSDVTTTTYPIFPSINGNKVLVFDGVNDSLTTTLAVNPTGGMFGAVVVKPNINNFQMLLSSYDAGAGNRLNFFLDGSGVTSCRVYDAAGAFIGRTTPASSYAANETFVLSFIYNGGITAASIKVFKNGTQIDNGNSGTGTYAVPVAGAVLTIGARNGGTFLNGSLSDIVFKQGAVVSDAEHLGYVNMLMDRHGI